MVLGDGIWSSNDSIETITAHSQEHRTYTAKFG